MLRTLRQIFQMIGFAATGSVQQNQDDDVGLLYIIAGVKLQQLIRH